MRIENEILSKIDNKEKLSEDEIRSLAGNFEIETEYGENRRWSRGATTIVDISGRHFAIVWEQGLTESQPDEYWEQPYEVKLCEYDKVVRVREWRRKFDEPKTTATDN